MKTPDFIKVIFIVALIALLTACSLKTFYNRLDYLIPSYVEGMVSLDEVLEEKVDQRSLRLINWHRNTQLMQYADWFRNLQQDANPQLTLAQLQTHITTMESFWQTLLLKIDEEMVILLPLLNTVQRKELFASITDKNEEFRDDFVDIDEDERIEQYTDTMLDYYDNWLGDLTDDQERVVENAAATLSSGAGIRLQRRLLWQRNIQHILDTSATTAEKSRRLRAFFTRFNIYDDAELNAITQTNIIILAKLTVQIVHSLTSDQKDYFINKTDEYIRIFTELAENR